jgi:glycosyltransferase involved in cell wall biosynthesis
MNSGSEVNTKKSICVVVSSPMTLRTFLAPHVAALQERYAVTAVAHLGAGEPRPVGPGTEFVSLPIERRIAPLRDLAALARLARLFRRSRFAAVQSVTPKAGLLAMLAAVFARVPVRVHIFTGQVWATRRGFSRWLLKQMDCVIAACATHVLVDSPSQREFLLGEGVVDPGKSRVLGKGSIAGVDASRFRPDPVVRGRLRAQLGCREDDVVFLYLGRLNRDKGVLDLAAAFSRVAATREELRLLIVGPDEDGMQPAMRAALGRAAPRATFVDYSDRPEHYMAAADVFCLPSYREGFGSVIIEAGACGVPAIGSRIYGITDAIEDGASGLLFDPGSIEALAECMSRLARDPALRHGMGERARAKALRDFPQSAVTAELAGLYADVIG